MVANSGKLSTMNSNPTAILTDKVDSPHSGLFTGIHSMAQGNYALKDHASTLGFAHTFTTSSGVIRVALTAGKGFSDGKYIAVDALSAHDLTQPATGAFYHWAVFTDDGDGTGTADIILGSTDGVVPELTAGSTPISLIKIQSTDTHSTVAFQTFTTSKTENALSIGYSNSNVYTEMSKISSAAAGTTVEVGSAGGDFIIDNTDQDKKIVMRLGTDTSATAFEVRDNSDAVKFSVAGDGAFAGIPVTAVANGSNNRVATFSSASALNGEANLTFDASTDILRIQGSDGGAGIDPSLVLARNSASPANNDNLGNIDFEGRNTSDNADVNYARIYAKSVNISDSNSAKESAIYFAHFIKDTSATTAQGNVIFGSEEVSFNNQEDDLDFRVSSDDESHMFFVDGDNNRISIGDSVDVPAATLEITNHASAGAFGVPLLQLNSNDTDKIALDINAANIDANVIDITADALTTGSVLNIVSNSASTATRNLVHIHNDHADASGTTALKVTNDHANSDGAGPPVAHLVHAGLGDTLRLEAINDTDSTAPDLVFKKTTSNGNAASGELIGNIDWVGVNAGNAEHRYANMYCRINNPTAGSETGELKIETMISGTTKERISFEGVRTTINADGANIDTKILDFAGGDLLFADAQRKSVGFGEQPVDINASLYSKLAIGLKETTAPTATADYGKIWTQNDNELYFQDGQGGSATNTVIKRGGKQTMWVPAAAMYPNTTSGCSALTQVELSNGPELKCLDFDDGATESAQFTVAFPKSWNEGTVTFKAYWCSTATDTDGVSWGLRACGMNDNETINLAFGTQIVVDDANQGAANELMVTAESSAITIAGTPAAEDLTFFQISRIHDDGNDTAAEDARLLGIKLYYTTDAGNDV